MTQDQPLLAVQEALKKCFLAVEEQEGRWQSALQDCPALLASLGNLAEQLQAAEQLRFEDVRALRAFPDLKARLRLKQLTAADVVLDKLGERLAALLSVCDEVSSHVARGLRAYEQRADAVGIEAVLQASAVSPSVADMLEWLQDIERYYRNAYLKRKCLLSSVQWEDLANIQALPRAWDRIAEEEQQDLVQEILHTRTQAHTHSPAKIVTQQQLDPGFLERMQESSTRREATAEKRWEGKGRTDRGLRTAAVALTPASSEALGLADTRTQFYGNQCQYRDAKERDLKEKGDDVNITPDF